MKDKLEAKLKTLKENQATVETQIIKGQELLRKAQADLNAILGAIQVVDQLLEDTEMSFKTKETKKDDRKN